MLSKEATMCITQQQMSSLLLRPRSESWLSSTLNPSRHKGVSERSPSAESQGLRAPAWNSPTSASARAGSHVGAPSPHLIASQGSSLCLHAGQSKPGACSPEPTCSLRPVLALAVPDELLAGTGDASRQQFLFSSRARQQVRR